MFEISKLKEKKLSELQEIADELKISKYKTLKKLDLVYKILDHQASNPDEKESNIKKNSPKPSFDRKNRSNTKRSKDSNSNDEVNDDKSEKKSNNHTRDNRNRKPKSQ